MGSETSHAEVQAEFAAVEAAIREAREALQRLQDGAASRYGKEGATFVVLAVGAVSEELQKLEEGPLLDLMEELSQTEIESAERWIETVTARAG